MLYIYIDQLFIKYHDQDCEKFLQFIDTLEKKHIYIQYSKTIYNNNIINKLPIIVSNNNKFIGIYECISYIESLIG